MKGPSRTFCSSGGFRCIRTRATHPQRDVHRNPVNLNDLNQSACLTELQGMKKLRCALTLRYDVLTPERRERSDLIDESLPTGAFQASPAYSIDFQFSRGFGM